MEEEKTENFHSLYFREKERGRTSWSSQLHDTLIEPIYNILNFIAVQGSFPKERAKKSLFSRRRLKCWKNSKVLKVHFEEFSRTILINGTNLSLSMK